MEQSAPAGVRISQKDVGLAIILLGISYAIGFISPLTWIGLVIGLVAIILLIVRRHDLTVRQEHVLYASILIYVLTYIGFVVAVITEAVFIVGNLFSQGFTGSSLPASSINSLMNFILIAGSVYNVIIVFCNFVIPFSLANRRLQYALIGGFLVSVGLKIYDLYWATKLLGGLTSTNATSVLTIANSVPYKTPLIVISLVSTFSLGLVIIYLGNLIRTGKLDPFPREYEPLP